MKYDIILFNADHGEHKFLCRIMRCNDTAPAFEVAEDAKFTDEAELRQKLTGILPSGEVEKAVETLHSHHMQEARFRSVEIADQKIKLLGWELTRTGPSMEAKRGRQRG